MKDCFNKDITPLKSKKLFLLDMDGTIYLGNRLFSGINEFLHEIISRGANFTFITNNATRSVKDYVNKLKNLGVKNIDETNFFTSVQATVNRLNSDGIKRVYAQGTRSFVNELISCGILVTEEYDQTVDGILVAFDTEVTYQKIFTTCKMLTELDKPYYATNPDWSCPTEFGYVPDCGSMCQGYFNATGKKPIYIGKPQPEMIYAVIKKFSLTPSDVVVIGDRLYTDISAGVNAGVDTVCVLSGEATLNDVINSQIKPTYTLNDVTEIFR